jgi:hypothetical protein
MRRSLVALGATVVALLVIASIASAAFERHARARTLAQYPPPGELVDIATREIEEDDDWFADAGTVRTLGSRPTFVLSGMKSVPERLGLTPADEAKRLELWRAMQNELAALSTVSRHEEDLESDHYVQTSDPPRVVAAVKCVVTQVR